MHYRDSWFALGLRQLVAETISDVLSIRYLQRKFRVVRIKNRFAGDVAEAVSVERLQAEFYAAETRGEDMESNASGSSGLGSYAPLQG